jgi:hypothetical protein
MFKVIKRYFYTKLMRKSIENMSQSSFYCGNYPKGSYGYKVGELYLALSNYYTDCAKAWL